MHAAIYGTFGRVLRPTHHFISPLAVSTFNHNPCALIKSCHALKIHILYVVRHQKTGMFPTNSYTSANVTRVKRFLSSAPRCSASQAGNRGTSIAGVLMFGLAVIRISLVSQNVQNIQIHTYGSVRSYIH